MIDQIVAQYRIVAYVGEGAQGVVWKAEHVRLHHPVAIKFLRSELMQDESVRARFQREAEIAASLDSPSLCPVIDFGETEDGQTYLVQKYCDGVSLRSRLEQGPLPLERAVLFAIQIAEGLEVAHGHGIVHRDVKPSNIIITTETAPTSDPGASPDHPASTVVLRTLTESARLTDFGLALPSDGLRLTRDHVVLGTLIYMAPEQARGETLDGRTDIWALGAVIYEMVTGRRPFPGDSPDAVIYNITHSPPRPVSESRPEAPAELVWVIDKALRKDPADRYQDTAELLRDLRLAWRRVQPGGRRDLGSWVLESRGRLLWFTAALIVLAVALVFKDQLLPAGDRPSPLSGTPRQVTTSTAWESAPAVSPDGSRVAFVGDATGDLDLYLTSARGGRSVPLTRDPAVDTEPAWLPDGSGLVFASDRSGTFDVWKIGESGGAPVLLVSDARDPAVSSDGEHIAFTRLNPGGEARIWVTRLDDPGAARQITRTGEGLWAHHAPAWSPDGRRICYSTVHDLWVVDADGGAAVPLTSGGAADDSPVWSRDGRHIYFSSLRENTLALWRVAAGGGEPERLTQGSGPESLPSLSLDGSVLSYTTAAEEVDEDLVILDRRRGERFRLSGRDDAYQPTIAPDGSAMCYVGDRWEGRNELWLQPLRNGRPEDEPRRLTDQPGSASQPRFSPDGQWIVYYRILGSEERGVWIVSATGGQPRPFTEYPGANTQPAWSPDGDQLAFVSDREGVPTVWVAPVVAGNRAGDPVRISPADLAASFPAWSPDGHSLAFIGHRAGQNEICVVSAEGSVVCHLPTEAEPHCLRWHAATGQLWVIARWNDQLSLRAIDPITGESSPLSPPVDFERAVATTVFDMDRNGDLVVYSLPLRQGDIWVLESDRGTY